MQNENKWNEVELTAALVISMLQTETVKHAQVFAPVVAAWNHCLPNRVSQIMLFYD